MTDTTTEPSCRFPGCYEPVHAEGICLDHWEVFHGPQDAAATSVQPQPASAAPAPPSGRLRISPLHAVVRAYSDGSAILGVYGVYGSMELAENAASMLVDLGIPDEMRIVPFYEVTP